MRNWFWVALFAPIASGLLLFVAGAFSLKAPPVSIIISAKGSQPAVVAAKDGSLHVTFGYTDKILYAYSANGGGTFTPVKEIATLPDMHLGITRGPQIALTTDFVVVANVTKQGRIMVYRRPRNGNQWSKPVNLLDTDITAPEGFVALAAGPANTVYAAWLDMRLHKQNNVYSAFSEDGGKTWSENKLVYASPAGKVCECCRPSVAADTKGNVYVMFRNNLAGSRDMYLAQSTNGGKTFRTAQKLGLGTWPLQACPMEGGGLAITPQGKPITIWKRQKEIFVTSPGLAENVISEGRNCSVATSTAGNLYVWQQNNIIWAKTPGQLMPVQVGTGTYPRAVSNGKSHLIIYESNAGIVARQVPEVNSK
ncbi:sialidase family protein [Adhaeribacter pallidiroseus]|uniref:Sialidase domain-containing protein n=1 Tax=Adhaeribacter pallidiroseus TaxID=2072847 RepID=A0A369QNP6_9BACT|nr:sialidase family protein [Adhaeribacter pallidiroseus]RDC66511.1 hypothetical protein AHMF7616_05142 [Adhaeribacter pallidiroseus]